MNRILLATLFAIACLTTTPPTAHAEYVDGMSLYRGYFVPGTVDPNGLTTFAPILLDQSTAKAIAARAIARAEKELAASQCAAKGNAAKAGGIARAAGIIFSAAGQHAGVTGNAVKLLDQLIVNGDICPQARNTIIKSIRDRKSRGAAAQFMQLREVEDILVKAIKTYADCERDVDSWCHYGVCGKQSLQVPTWVTLSCDLPWSEAIALTNLVDVKKRCTKVCQYRCSGGGVAWQLGLVNGKHVQGTTTALVDVGRSCKVKKLTPPWEK